MNFNCIIKTGLVAVAAMVSLSSFSQDLIARQAPIDKKLKSVDSLALQKQIRAEQSEYPDLSLGTVYRNLKKFCAEGKARSVGVINGQEHFDGDTSAHSHFVCDCCGRVLDIFEPLADTETLERMEAEHGFTITKEDLLFGGVCAECKEKSKNKTA